MWLCGVGYVLQENLQGGGGVYDHDYDFFRCTFFLLQNVLYIDICLRAIHLKDSISTSTISSIFGSRVA
jgi:hypothetical protein